MVMETDIGTVEPNRIDFQGLRNEPYQPLEEEEPASPMMLPQHMQHPPTPPPQPQWDPSQYYMPPQQNDSKKDIFAEMDRTTYIIIFVAFIFGFFIGRGMIQPVILKGH